MPNIQSVVAQATEPILIPFLSAAVAIILSLVAMLWRTVEKGLEKVNAAVDRNSATLVEIRTVVGNADYGIVREVNTLRDLKHEHNTDIQVIRLRHAEEDLAFGPIDRRHPPPDRRDHP